MKSRTVGNNKTNNAWALGDLEEWQTQEVNVTLGFASGDIDLLGLPFLKVALKNESISNII